MSKQRRVAVLMGGMSTEHDVSLRSGAGVVRALEEKGHTALPVTISKEGRWRFPEAEATDVYDAVARLGALGADCVFIALHGGPGEDGRIPGMLDLLGLPYTCSGSAASALSMDKFRAKALMREMGLRVARHEILMPQAWEEDRASLLTDVSLSLGFPCVVKTPRGGSSVGVEIVADADTLTEAVDRMFSLDDEVLVEEFIRGVEITCGVWDATPNEAAFALPVTEIRPVSARFFDYEAKYTPGATVEITPAEISEDHTREAQAMALKAHRVLRCAVWSRSDFMVDEHGPVWIEINTVPGLTPTSLYPQACAHIGIGYADMVERFVEAAIHRRTTSTNGGR